MAAIAEAAAEGLDVRLDVTVGDVDSIDAEAVIVTAPSDDYDEMLALLCVLDRPSAVPSPGGAAAHGRSPAELRRRQPAEGDLLSPRADGPRSTRM